MNSKILLLVFALIVCSVSVFAGAAVPTVVINSPLSGSNLTVSNGTSTAIVVGVTVTGLNSTTNVSNVTATLMSSANVTIATIFSNITVSQVAGNLLFNLSIVSANISDRSDGIRNYTLRVQVAAVDSAVPGVDPAVGNSSNVNISVVNTVPTFTLNAPANASNQTSTSVTFNFTVISSDYSLAGANDTYNFTCTVYSGVTNTTSTSFNFRNSNASTIVNASMTQKLHKWRAQCVDAFGIGANSSIRDLTVDGTQPLNANVTVNASFGFQKNAQIMCASSDAIDNGSNVSLYIQPAGLSSFRLVANDSNNLTFDFTETAELGFYQANCSVRDYTGNQNSSTTQFEIVKVVSDHDYVPTNRPFATKIIGSGKTVDIGVLETSDARLMAKDAVLLFTVNGEQHRITVKEIAPDNVVLEVASTPQQMMIKVGESENVDLNGDGVDDVNVKLNGVFRAKADLLVTNLKNVPAPVVEQPTNEGPSVIEEDSSPRTSGKTILIILIIVAIVLVAGYLWVRFRPRGGKVSFNNSDLGGRTPPPQSPPSPMYPRSAPAQAVNHVARTVQPLTFKAKPIQSLSNDNYSALPYNPGNSRVMFKRYPER